MSRVDERGDGFEAWQVRLHGHRVIYHTAGDGPPVVLIHGMVNSSRHWREVALRLADRHLVIAPDLIGHGDSATPRGDYSLGAHAACIRDLLAVLGVGRATIVGHSLGGGVAMQFFYQFPQRTERLVLVSSGGLGREVSPLLRSATLPGASALLDSSPTRACWPACAPAATGCAHPARARVSTCRRSPARCARWSARGRARPSYTRCAR
jgi:pimeloyl-ACP methyl ester carboxylesterase